MLYSMGLEINCAAAGKMTGGLKEDGSCIYKSESVVSGK